METKKNIFKFIFKALLILLTSVVILTGAFLFGVYKYREKIAGKLISQSRDLMGIEISYRKVGISILEHWPQVSVKLEGMSAASLQSGHKEKPFLFAENLFVSFSLRDLLHGETVVNDVSLKNGRITLVVDSLGNRNFDFKKKRSNSYGKSLNIQKITLDNIELVFLNLKRKKHIAMRFRENLLALRWVNDYVMADLTGKLEIAQVLLKSKKGPMFYNKTADEKLHFIFLRKKNWIYIDKPSELEIDSQKYVVKGMIFLDSLNRMDLRIAARVRDFQNTVSLLNTQSRHNLRYIRLKKPFNADLFMVVKFGSDEDPLLKMNFDGNDNRALLGSAEVPYEHLKFRGELLCLPDAKGIPDLKNAVVKIEKFSGRLYDFPFKAVVNVNNLNDPYLKVQAHMDINSKNIKFKAGRDFDLHGFCFADINYEGPTEKIGRTTFLDPPMILKGTLKIENVTYKTATNKLPFTLKGKAILRNHDISFDDLVLGTKGGDFHLKGKALGFTPYMYDLTDGFKADVIASSSFIDFTPLAENTTPKRNVDSTRRVKEKKKIVNTLSKNDFEFNLKLKIDRLQLRKLEAKNAEASVHYEDDVINLRKMQVQTCDGTLIASAWLYNYSKTLGHVYLKEVDIQKLFVQCENFGQDAITADNLSGTISASTNISLQFGDSFRPDMKTLAMDAETALRDGHLTHYEPMKKISRYIFKRRNFDDISFTEMRPTFTIRGNELKLDTMEIASSVMNVFVSGVYHFNGESNFNFILPWSNLKPRKDDYEPHNLAADGQVSRGLKLNLHGPPHDMKLRLGNK